MTNFFDFRKYNIWNFLKISDGKTIHLFLYLFVLLNFLFLHGYLVASSFALDDNDFIIMVKMLQSPDKYSGTVFFEFSKILKNISGFFYVSSFFWYVGIDEKYQYYFFHFMMIFFSSIGLTSFVSVFRVNFGGKFILLNMIVFSIFTYFGRFVSLMYFVKAISSTIVLGIGFFALALFVRGRYRAAAFIAALMFYFHPAHAGILALLIIGYLALSTLLHAAKGRFEGIKDLATCCSIFLVSVPFFVQYYFATRGASAVDWELWLKFLEAKTSNPLPMGDGFPVVASIVSAIFMVTMIWWRLIVLQGKGRIDEDRLVLVRAGWCAAILLVFWVIQIFFTHFQPSQLVIKIVFTRATPYAGFLALMAVFLAAYWGIENSTKRPFAAVSWVLVLAAACAAGLQPVFPAPSYPELLHPWVMDMISNGHDKSIANHYNVYVAATVTLALLLQGRLGALVEVLSVLSIGLGYLAFGGLPTYVLLGAALIVHWFVNAGHWWGVISELSRPIRMTPAFVLIVPGCVLLLFWNNGLVDRAVRTLTTMHDAVDHEAEAVMAIVRKHTDPGAGIVHVPHGDDISSHVLMERPVYLDRMETQYALYAPELTPIVVERLKTYGVDIDDILKDPYCGWRNRGFWIFMCKRRLYYVRTTEYNDNWRNNLEDMKKNMPNIGYALIRKDHSCMEDFPISETDRYLFVELDKIGKKGCRKRQIITK